MTAATKKKQRFVIPEEVRLDLSDGDWLDVKRELNHGEQQRLTSFLNISPDGQVSGGATDRYMIERKFMYINDWSFENEKGKRVPVTRQAIANLSQETADEIDEALNEHFERMQAEKKAPSGKEKLEAQP